MSVGNVAFSTWGHNVTVNGMEGYKGQYCDAISVIM